MRSCALPWILCLGLLPFLPARAEGPSAESKGRAEIAERILQFAGWCSEHAGRPQGLEALEEARDLDPAAPALAGIEKALGELGEGGDFLIIAAKRREAGKEIAKGYDRLSGIKHDTKEDARFLRYVEGALRWDPSEGRIQRALAAAEQAGVSRPDEAGRLLRAVERADPEGAAKGKYDAPGTRLAQKDVLLLGSPTQDLMAYVSLPKGWAKGKTWPVLVGVEGAGCGFLGYERASAAARGSRGVILVVPITLSNTNALNPASYPVYAPSLLRKWDGNRIEFDGKGVAAVLAEVTRRFGGEEKVFVTGFSGGGNYCYYRLIADPARTRGAVPCCANFAGYGSDGAPGAGADGGPPVHILTGEKDEHREFTFGKRDSPGIEPQTDNAVATLQRLGYRNVRRTMVKGAGHSALHAEVWKFVDEILTAR